MLKFLVSFCHAMLCKCGLRCHAVSVCVSVHPLRSWILSKRINMCSKIFHHRVATAFYVVHTERHGDIPTITYLTGTSNAGGVGRNRDSQPKSCFTACC